MKAAEKPASVTEDQDLTCAAALLPTEGGSVGKEGGVSGWEEGREGVTAGPRLLSGFLQAVWRSRGAYRLL